MSVIGGGPGGQRVVCIVQARLGSNRLPGKCLKALHGEPLIAHVFQRAITIRGVDQVVLATSHQERDSPLSDYVYGTLGLDVFRGDETDVLRRYLYAGIHFQADVVMRITGDCPFLAPDVAEAVLHAYWGEPLGVEYVTNDTTCSGYPDGVDVEVFSMGLLEMAAGRSYHPSDREHVTSWMRREVPNGMIKAEADWSKWKLSVDSPEDYDFAVRLADKLPRTGERDARYSLQTTLRAVEEMVRGE